jgi:ATP-dependent DNA ligase
MLMEQKVDGYRAVCLPDHMGRKRLFTRGGHTIESTAHILYRLAQMERAAGCPMVFDGEFQVAGTLNATKRWAESGWKMGGEAGQLFLFDAMPLADWERGRCDVPLVERKALLARLAAESEAHGWEWRPGSKGRDDALPPVVVLEDSWAFDAADVVAEVRRVWAAGGEGVMAKYAEAPYVRSRNGAWLKVKGENAHRWMRLAA